MYISSEPTDDFARPAEEWSYEKGGVIGSFNKEPIAVYTAKASKGDLFNLIGSIDVSVLTGDATDNALNDDDFAQIVDYKEDDYILYTYAKDEIQTVAKAELLTGEVTAYSVAADKAFGDASGSVSIEGTKYDYAKFAEVDSENGCATTYTVGVDASIVLDKYGYAIYVDDASMSVGNYVYIATIANETNLSTSVVAEAYFTDGRDETITVKNIYAHDGETTLDDELGRVDRLDDATIKGWYSYSRNSKGEYTLTRAETTAKLSGTEITQNKVSIAGTVNGNSSTLFIVKDKNDDIKLYTGIANVPDISGITVANSWYLRDGDTAGKPASVVFVDATNGSVKNSTSNFLYLLRKDSTSVDKSDNETVYTWIVLLDGKVETIQTKQSWTKNTLYENYSAPAGRAVGDDVTSFTADSYYTVTINGTEYADVLCETDHILVVAYTVKAADLEGNAPKIIVESIVEGEEPNEDPACTHENLTKTDAVDPTCTEDGNIDCWTCDDCGKMFSDAAAETEIQSGEEVVNATGHDETLAHHEAQDPDCTNDGTIEYWTCESCGTNFDAAIGGNEIASEDDLIDPATGHTQTFTFDANSTPHTHSAAACFVCNDAGTAVTSEACADGDSDGNCDKCGEAVEATAG